MHEGNKNAWLIWLIAGIFYLYEFIHRIALSVMLPELSAAFNVSNAMLSNLSAYYFLAYAIAQLPVGLLIDRYGTRLLLTIACLSIAIASFMFAITSNIWIANFSRIIIGLSSAFAFVGCLKLAATWFPGTKFAFVVGLTNLLGVLGAIVGGNPIALAVDAFGWRSVMFSSGILGLCITFLLWHFVRDGKLQPSKLSKKLSAVLSNKQSWFISIFAGCMVAPIVAYSELWGVSFLMQAYDLSRPLAAQISTTAFVGIALGGPIIGWLSDHYRQRTFFMWLGMLGALVAIGLILFIPRMPIWQLYFLHITFGFFSSSMLLSFSLNSEATLPNVRGTTLAFTNTIIMIAGALLQSISGMLLDYTNYDYNISFVPLMLCYVAAILCFRFIKDTHCTFCDESK